MSGPGGCTHAKLDVVRRTPRHLPRALPAALIVVGAACGGGGGDAERFCGEVQANRRAILDPTLAAPTDVDATLELYRSIGDVAPLDIAAEWDRLVVNLETASTVEPDDPDSLQQAVASAYATERSAIAVRDWLRSHCRVDLGPVATIVTPAPTAPRRPPPATVPG